MRTSTILASLAAVAPVALAQRPSNVTMCDYYTNATFKANNATLQYQLLTALVNTAVIGNYSNTSMNAVTGILNNGTYEGRNVSLIKYFDGMLASTNRGGESGVSVNFLDGGAADPLKMNMPANDTSSNQYFLLTHLYSYFGSLLNCTGYDSAGFAAYEGGKSQYNVHKFMDLSHDEVSYFIQEVGLAATSFGVTTDDATAVGMALGNIFNYRCAPETTVIKAQGPALQSICTASDCPQAPMSNCAAYMESKEPAVKNDTNAFTSTSMMASGTMSATGTGAAASGTETMAAGDGEGVAARNFGGVGAAVMGVAGLAALAAGL